MQWPAPNDQTKANRRTGATLYQTERASSSTCARASRPRRSFAIEPDSLVQGLRRSRELADGLKHDFESSVVFAFQVVQTPRKLRVRQGELAKLHEGANDLDARLDGRATAKHIRQHHGAVLRENIGQLPSPASARV